MPLATLAATVAADGISAPTYDAIYQSLQESYQAIFGADAYIAPDSQDGQLLAVFSKAVNDCNNAAKAVYNNYSPQTSQGEGLSTAVKINGLARRVAGFSTADVAVVGVSGTIITNGRISDQNNVHQWALPVSVTIPPAGTITVTATCADLGAIEALTATLTKIVTPTLGWQTVTNGAAAVPGEPVETDAGLRRRQRLEVALPANSALGALVSGIANVVGVTDISIHENYTDATDSEGVPEHCIAVVVVGGDINAIASAIALKKTPGCNTFGTISVPTLDPDDMPITVRFSRPTDITANVVVNVHALTGYSTDVPPLIQASVGDYLDALDIEDTLYFNRLWVPASIPTNAFAATFKIQSMTLNGGTADIVTGYDERIVAGTVTVNSV